MSDHPEKLSDLHPEIGDIKPDDIIKGRMFRNQLIREAAQRGNVIALQSELLHEQAKSMGIDVTYSEDLDDDDMDSSGGIF